MRKIIALAAAVELLALTALAVQATRMSGAAERHPPSAIQIFGPDASMTDARAASG
jgi:hypothetical protein